MLRKISEEVLASVEQSGPDRVDGHVENVGNLLTGVTLYFEQHEYDSALLAHSRQQILQQSLLLFERKLSIGKNSIGCKALHRARNTGLHDTLQPLLSTVLNYLSLGDSMQPSRNVSPVEVGETTTHHEKDVLSQVFDICLGGSKHV